jgi:tetratricopeptide (TPR) repeat protein
MYILGVFLVKAGRHEEALPLFDGLIEQHPDDVRSAIAKAVVYLHHRDDPEKALSAIDLALERAFRTKFYRRQALGVNARILLKLGRGEELGQVLEQIMSLEMFFDVRDTGRERDFVDRVDRRGHCRPLRQVLPEDRRHLKSELKRWRFADCGHCRSIEIDGMRDE